MANGRLDPAVAPSLRPSASRDPPAAHGERAGLVIAVVSAAIWLLADLTAGSVYSHPLIPYWNAAVRLGYFGLHTLLLVTLLELIGKMERLAFGLSHR